MNSVKWFEQVDSSEDLIYQWGGHFNVMRRVTKWREGDGLKPSGLRGDLPRGPGGVRLRSGCDFEGLARSLEEQDREVGSLAYPKERLAVDAKHRNRVANALDQ